MSYGTDAPELDFELFDVACLSGRNGQGKSALLDALTWSLWGEARKSSGSHKPDDELLRIGARAMQVEFVFDVEGERYRVVRSYAKSATGKTSRSELELNVFEASEADYRPLTGASMRETQEKIERVVGLDYDTFINSAFLLQGRSDEFTKKRPSERKEILARILNLGRYEGLYELAATRERDAKRAVEQAEQDIERLRQRLEPEPEWKAAHARTEADLQAARERLEALRTEERCLTERLAELDACAREAEGLRQSLEALQGRLLRHQQDAADLRERIRQAEALIARRAEIQHAHERRQALQLERDELDNKNELFRGIEKQIERTEADLKDRMNAFDRQLERLEILQKNETQQRDALAAQLAEEAAVRRQFEKTQAARRRFEELGAVVQKRDTLNVEIQVLEKRLLGLREALSGKVKALEEQIRRDRAGLPDVERLEAEAVRLEEAADRMSTLRQQLQTTEESGKAVSEDMHTHSGELTARRQEREKLEVQLDRLEEGVEGRCPTCGTELTAAHRAEVRAQFEEKIAALRSAEAFLLQQINQRKEERTAFREAYRSVREEITKVERVPEELARVREQLRRAEEARRGLEAREAEVDAFCRSLQEESYGETERGQVQALQQQRAALAFDEEAYERIRDEAAQSARYEDRLRQLEEVKGRREQLDKSVARRQQEIDDLRRGLDEGTGFAPLQDKLRRLHEQLAEVGFDPQRFREVRQSLEQLSDAGSRMTALVNAQQNQAEWKERLETVEAQAEQIRQDHATRQEKLADLDGRLNGRAAVEEQQRDKAAACRGVEAELQDLQVRYGQLHEKLDRAARDREQLKRCRKDLLTARHRRSLYKHLKAAFGKHGIPSLIIERTLPEIEDRTNDLLERLTDGRMHVRLETLKDKKTGGTKETLEIKITDEQGVSRAYETFSGGEGFRVNFALRIALAQLLAERNGVRIRTLVIDEGFGTQDQQGVQNLVEAIHTIQDDFAKILVITHLPDLKEAFPVRIEVEKDPAEGSRFEVHGV